MKESMLETILRETEDPVERESLREAWERMELLEDVEPSPELERRFAGTIKNLRAGLPRPVSPARRILPFAAVLVIGIAIGILALRLSHRLRGDETPLDSARVDSARLGRIASTLRGPHTLAPHRLDLVEALAELDTDPEARQILIEVVRSDPSVDVRLRAIDALGRFAGDDTVARPFIETTRNTESTLVRIRLIEVLVDRQVDAALPTIRSLATDPRADELVREAATWASDRL